MLKEEDEKYQEQKAGEQEEKAEEAQDEQEEEKEKAGEEEYNGESTDVVTLVQEGILYTALEEIGFLEPTYHC